MTEEEIKEGLSNNYVGILANRNGYTLTKPPDYGGVDYILNKELKRKMPNGKYREFSSGYSCHLQLKATTIKSVEIKPTHLVYDLEAKNYNDLIYRKQTGSIPLILVLFVLPENEESWVTVLKNELKLKKYAYYYYPSKKEKEEVKNSSTKRIKIPLSNKLDLNFFKTKIVRWVPEWR